MVMTDKKMVVIFISIVAVLVLGFTLFGWAKPMTMNDKDDVNDIKALLVEDSATIEILSIGDVGTYKGADYQFVEYTITKDSVTTKKSASIEVEKKFLNYQCKGILEP